MEYLILIAGISLAASLLIFGYCVRNIEKETEEIKSTIEEIRNNLYEHFGNNF